MQSSRSICSSDQIQERAHFQEYFVQDDWKVSDRLTINPGLRYTLNFPSTEINGQTAVFNLQTQQLEYPGRPSRCGRCKKDNFGPRLGVVYRAHRQDDRQRRLRPGLDRDGRHHHAVHDADVSVPADGVAARARQRSTRRSCCRTGRRVAPIAPTPNAGLGQGVFAVDGTLGSGYVQQWNASVQRELTTNTTVEAAYVGSNITHVGIPDTNLNQLTVDQLALGAPLLQRVPNPYFGIIPRSSSLGDPTIPVGAAAEAVSRSTRPSASIATTSARRATTGLELEPRQRLRARAARTRSRYTRSKLMDDASSVFDASILTGPIANYPVADSFNRALERDYSTGDIPHVFVASVVWDLPVGAGRAHAAARRARRAGQRLDGDGARHAAVGRADRRDADDELQRVRRLRRAAAESGRRSRRCRPISGHRSHWFNTAAFAVAPQFTTRHRRRAIRCAGPSYRDVDLALMRRVPIGAGRAIELRAEVFNLLNTPTLGAPTPSPARRTSARSRRRSIRASSSSR